MSNLKHASSPASPFRLNPVLSGLLQAGLLLGAASAFAQSAPSKETTLDEVKVIDKSGNVAKPYAGGQVSRGGSLGLLGNQDVMDTPFSTTNYTSELLENQQARTLADVVVNDASVRMTTGSNGFDDTFTIRGLSVSATDVGFNGLYGLISQNRVPAQMIERVEILKGPGALINGIAPSGSVGGGINVVTKRASDVPLTRLTGIYTDRANFALAADVGRRFGADNAWGIRFNGLLRDGEGSVSGGNVGTAFGTLALDYRGARVRASLDAIIQRDDTDNFRPQISLASIGTVIPAAPNARTNWYPSTTLKQKDDTIAGRVEFDATDKLTLYAALGYRDGGNDQVFPQSTTAVDAAGNFVVRNNYYDSYTKTTSGTTGFAWNFSTGPVNHKLVGSYTSMYQESGNAFITGLSRNSNIYSPAQLPPILAARTSPVKASEQTFTSFAIADVISFAQERVLITVGARRQQVELDQFNAAGGITSSYNASKTSPLGAIVVKPLSNVSVYANYAEGLTRGQIVAPPNTNAGAVLPPYQSKQKEAGVKVDFGRITTTAAVYQIERPSIMVDTAGNQGYFGEARYRGLELSAYGEIMPGLRGMASVAFVDPVLTKTAGGVNQGKDVQGVPDKTASAGLDWDTPWVRGLSLNGRVIYTSGPYLTPANAARFDAWTRFDIGARYRTIVAGKPVVLRANIENVANKNYWLTTGTYVAVGAPRTVVLSASVDF